MPVRPQSPLEALLGVLAGRQTPVVNGKPKRSHRIAESTKKYGNEDRKTKRNRKIANRSKRINRK